MLISDYFQSCIIMINTFHKPKQIRILVYRYVHRSRKHCYSVYGTAVFQIWQLKTAVIVYRSVQNDGRRICFTIHITY